MQKSIVDLSKYHMTLDRGRPLWYEMFWRLTSALVFQNPCVPFYGLKRMLLRYFGAKVGVGVLIKPRVTITFPWKLSVGDHVWIGEGAWIDNLDHVTIGNQVCLSQGTYLCTGNHDFTSPTFDLRTAPIHIEDGAWVGARASVAPGVTVHSHAVLALGSTATASLEAYGIYQGQPAVKVGVRAIQPN